VKFDDSALAAISEAVGTSAQPVEQWPEWMSVETAARYLGCSVERIRNLKDDGALDYSQEAKGCRVFFARADLDAYMRSLQVGR